MTGLLVHPLCVGMFAGPIDQIDHEQGDAALAPPFVSAMFIFVITGGEHPILVDTGTLGPAEARTRQRRILHRPPEMEPVRALAALGIEPDDVRIVVNTHLHWDHCANNDRFPMATIYLQRSEIAHAATPLPEHRAFYDKLPGVIPPWLAAWDRVEAIDGDHKIAPGVTIVALPGHSPGSQGVLVETGAGRYLIAGDTVNSFDDWETRRPPTVIVSESQWQQTAAHIEQLGCRVIPSHDLALIGHEPFG